MSRARPIDVRGGHVGQSHHEPGEQLIRAHVVEVRIHPLRVRSELPRIDIEGGDRATHHHFDRRLVVSPR